MTKFDIFLTADRETCVLEDNPRAAFLLMSAGGVFPSQADKEKYGAQVEALNAKAEAPKEDKAVKPHQNKAVGRIVQKAK